VPEGIDASVRALARSLDSPAGWSATAEDLARGRAPWSRSPRPGSTTSSVAALAQTPATALAAMMCGVASATGVLTAAGLLARPDDGWRCSPREGTTLSGEGVVLDLADPISDLRAEC
jgi:hypothetical protein